MSLRVPLPLRVLSAGWNGAPADVLAVYKPGGLPVFAASQVAACRTGASLFALQTPSAAGPRAAPPPAAEDPSDALLSRLVDAGGPGQTPYVALPLVSPLLLASRAGDSAAVVNGWTARWKGVLLLARSLAEAHVLRQAAQIGLVRRTYRVLCDLPAPLAEAVACGRAWTGPPPPHPLLHGGLVDVAAGTLRRRGRLRGHLRTALPLPAALHEVEETHRRLHGLFQRGPAAGAPSEDAAAHPWIPAEARLTVAVSDALLRARGGATAAAEGPFPGVAPGRRPIASRPVEMEYDLLALSGRRALYEVRGRDLLPEELQTLFAAEGFLVVNDYVHDAALAARMAAVAARLRRASPETWARAPMAVQHALRSASPEELVAAPLVRQPLLCADLAALHHLLAAPTPAAVEGELRERMEQWVTAAHNGSLHAPLTHPLLRVLAEWPQPEEARGLMQLSLGTGVECTAIVFPDPSHPPNLEMLQRLVRRVEKHGDLPPEARATAEAAMHFLVRRAEEVAVVPSFAAAAVTGGAAGGTPPSSSPSPSPSPPPPPPPPPVACSFTQALALAEAAGTAAAAARVEAHVPPMYEALWQRWRRLAAGDEGGPWSIPPSPWARVDESVEARRGAPEDPPRPFVLRVEELGEYHCASCGRSGHLWQTCPRPFPLRAVVEGGAGAPPEPQVPRLTREGTTTTTTEVVRTTAEARRLLLEASDAVARGVPAGRVSSVEGEHLLAVPNAAPTRPPHPDALRRARAKPPMQRRALRCVYCHGRHHITMCPKMAGARGATGGLTEAERCFCLRCGGMGHLYGDCPRAPAWRHPATHCAICDGPVDRLRHTPAQCPRRRSPPAGYSAEGERLTAAAEHRPRHRPHPPSRGRRSMLIADSFVDERA